jgi:hypothetical protein
MHSNCGITFDLHAIRARYPNKKILRFRSLVGNLEGKQGAYGADAWVLVDGKLRYSRQAFSREDGVEEIDVHSDVSGESRAIVATYSKLKQLFFSAVGQVTYLGFPLSENDGQYCRSESLSRTGEPSLAPKDVINKQL